MSTSTHPSTISISSPQEATHLEFHLGHDPEFASWFRENYRPLAGGWQY
jgi:hypothetical protein